MPVQVIIKRKLRVDQPEKLMPLLGQLRSRAKSQPGYLTGETLRNVDNHEKYLVISQWETIEDWRQWFHSEARREVQGKIDSLIGEKTFYEVFEPVPHT